MTAEHPFAVLAPGMRVTGVVPGGPVTVLAVRPMGVVAATVTYEFGDGSTGQRLVYATELTSFQIGAPVERRRSFDGDGAAFRLVAEALRIRMAGQFDPMLAVHTSELEPLPHQIRAVYGELLPRTPLRFLLADDPGAGKTIMAGLYIRVLRLVLPAGDAWSSHTHQYLLGALGSQKVQTAQVVQESPAVVAGPRETSA